MRHALFVSFFALTAALVVHAQEIPREQKTTPVLIRSVKPLYTPGLLNRNVAGVVELSAVVLTDGKVGDVSVTRSLDSEADEEAIRALTQWSFKPATLNGAPVPVTVSIEITFTRQSAPTVYRMQDGVTAPVATRRVNPMYPRDVAREGVIGTVLLEGVVRPDGAIRHPGEAERGQASRLGSDQGAVGMAVQARRAGRRAGSRDRAGRDELHAQIECRA